MTIFEWLIFFLVVQVIHGLGTWKLYVKSGYNSINAFIPVYNAVILMKIITKKENSFQILIINNSIGFIVSISAAYFIWQQPTLYQWIALISLGLLMICAQAFYINAIALADASYIAPFSYMTLIFVTFYDFALFDEIPDYISLIGISIILTGAILLAWREKIKLEPKI